MRSIMIAAITILFFAIAGTGDAVAQNYSMDLIVRYDDQTDSATLEWYPSFAAQINSFEIKLFTEHSNGSPEVVLSAGGNDRTISIDQITARNLYDVEIIALDTTGAQIETTPRERLKVDPYVPGNNPLAGVLDMTFISCNSSNFPFIYVTVQVTEDGLPIDDLTTDNFYVTEDTRHQTDYFHVTPPGSGGGVRLADIVFLIDTSGSMGGEIAAVRDNAIAFANALQASGIDYRLGLVQFGNSSGANPRIIGGGLTDDATEFVSWVSGLSASGSVEPGFAAIRMAITDYNFRVGAQKHFLIITDEDSDDRQKQATIDLILANDVTVHVAVDPTYGTSQSDYWDATSVRGVSGGLGFSVEGPYDDILDEIAGYVGNTYIVRYRTDNPIPDGVERFVEVTATKDTSTDTITCTYIPGGAPVIQRTPDTIALHNQPQVAGSPITIAVTVTDLVAPFVQDCTLFIRTSNSGNNFISDIMIHQGGDLYSIEVPGSFIQTPGLDYYIRASDGQVTSSDPTTDPENNPYQLAVLPNVGPVINHTPPASGTPNQDLPLDIHVVDDTYNIAEIKLYYRPEGELLWSEEVATFGTGDTDVNVTMTVPASSVFPPALEYYIKATDDFGVASLWPAGGADDPYVLTVGQSMQMQLFRIIYLNVVNVKNTSTRDLVEARGWIELDPMSDEFDPNSDDVSFSVNGETFVIPAGSFVENNYYGLTYYVLNKDIPNVGRVKMILCFMTRQWRMHVKGWETEGIFPSDGAVVNMVVADCLGEDIFDWTYKYAGSWYEVVRFSLSPH